MQSYLERLQNTKSDICHDFEQCIILKFVEIQKKYKQWQD